MNAYGSLTNRIMEAQPTSPVVGGAATIFLYSDRNPATVLAVNPKGNQAVIQEDSYTRTDENGMSECQEYAFTPNPQGTQYKVRQDKNGRWYVTHELVRRGTGPTPEEHFTEWLKVDRRAMAVTFGRRSKYHDFSF